MVENTNARAGPTVIMDATSLESIMWCVLNFKAHAHILLALEKNSLWFCFNFWFSFLYILEIKRLLPHV
jgi:hypothetical protein